MFAVVFLYQIIHMQHLVVSYIKHNLICIIQYFLFLVLNNPLRSFTLFQFLPSHSNCCNFLLFLSLFYCPLCILNHFLQSPLTDSSSWQLFSSVSDQYILNKTSPSLIATCDQLILAVFTLKYFPMFGFLYRFSRNFPSFIGTLHFGFLWIHGFSKKLFYQTFVDFLHIFAVMDQISHEFFFNFDNILQLNIL